MNTGAESQRWADHHNRVPSRVGRLSRETERARAKIHELLESEIPDFSAIDTGQFQSPHYDLNDPEAQALARQWWPEFGHYMEFRRAEEREALELSGQEGEGPYPVEKKLSRLFMMAESLLVKRKGDNQGKVGEVNWPLTKDFAQHPPAVIGSELSKAEIAAVFLLALAYPRSKLRQQIDEARHHLVLDAIGEGDNGFDRAA